MTVADGVLIHQLRAAVGVHAAKERIAIEESGTAIGYAQLAARIDAFAAGCRSWGLKRGDAVGVVASKSADAAAAFFGVMQAGGCACFIEPDLAPAVIAERLTTVGMRHLIHAPTVCLPEMPGIAMRDFQSLEMEGEAYADLTLTPDDRAMMLFTSGSTGAPKGILLSHANLTTNAYGVLQHTGTSPTDRLLHVMPLYHTNGVNNQLIVPLLAGATIAMVDRFRAEDTVSRLKNDGISYMTGVPTMYSRMLPHVSAGDRFPNLRFLRCGSAPITLALQEQIEAAFNVPLVISYGLSEATCTSTMNPPANRRTGTVGTVLTGQDVRLFEPGGGHEVAAGAEGEIRIGGRSLMCGYIGAATESPIVDGWLRTGDLGRFDADGYLSITGRIKDVIIRGGENISPALIEHHLATHPAVRDCCVVGMPHADLGEVPVAFIVTKEKQLLETEALAAFVLSRLSRIYVPAAFHSLETLPTNGVGKVDRAVLKKRLAADALH
jgi:acyl-CoA synthetase (AMP-forming)/AMP-acid ligase II